MRDGLKLGKRGPKAAADGSTGSAEGDGWLSDRDLAWLETTERDLLRWTWATD